MTPKQEAALRLAADAIDEFCELGAIIRPLEVRDAIREALAEQPAPPPECQTEAEKTAFAFGWWKALEMHRKPAQQQEPFGYFRYDLRLDAWVQNRAGLSGIAFYTSPPASKPLTDEQGGLT